STGPAVQHSRSPSLEDTARELQQLDLEGSLIPIGSFITQPVGLRNASLSHKVCRYSTLSLEMLQNLRALSHEVSSSHTWGLFRIPHIRLAACVRPSARKYPCRFLSGTGLCPLVPRPSGTGK